MPRAFLPHLVALLVGAAAALAVGCGDRSNLLPAAKASALDEQLDRVRAAVADGDCEAAGAALERARAEYDTIPGTVSRALRKRLREGLDRLETTVPDDCAAATTTVQTATTETVTTATETTPAPPETTETPTATATPTVTQTTPSTPTTQTATTQTPDSTGGAAPGEGTTP